MAVRTDIPRPPWGATSAISLELKFSSVYAGSGHARAADGSPVVPRPGLCQCVINAGFDIAFGLATNCGKFRNHQVAGPLQHPLLAERKRLQPTQITEVLEHISNLKNVSGPHLIGKIFEAVFPIIRRRREILGQYFEERIAFT